MGGSFAAAMDALERSAETPAGFCRPFLDVLPVSGASVSTVGDLLGSETLSASDELAARLDELQFDLGEGPCWDAMSSGKPVLEPDVRSLPRSLRMGAVDLYSVVPVSLDHTQTRQADAMAGVIGRYVLRQALNAVGRDEEEAGNAYSRRLLHQATGIVLAQLDVSAEDARLVIQGHAFAASRPVMDIAQEVLDGRLNFSRQHDGIEASE
jgi:hypothetical protein